MLHINDNSAHGPSMHHIAELKPNRKPFDIIKTALDQWRFTLEDLDALSREWPEVKSVRNFTKAAITDGLDPEFTQGLIEVAIKRLTNRQ